MVPIAQFKINQKTAWAGFAPMEMFTCLGAPRLVRFANRRPEYVVVVASSMGQGAIENEPTFEFVTIQHLPRFMHRLGVPDGAWTARSAMVPCLSVVVDEAYREPFRRSLEPSLRLSRKPPAGVPPSQTGLQAPITR